MVFVPVYFAHIVKFTSQELWQSYDCHRSSEEILHILDKLITWTTITWVSYQIRKIADCAFSPPPLVSDPDMHHGTCVTHVPWCMRGSLTRGFLWSRWRGKRSRHSRRIRNPHLVRGPWKPQKSNTTTKHKVLQNRLYIVPNNALYISVMPTER